MHKVMVQPAVYQACREAIDRAFELFPLNIRDKKVLVKPNAVMASDPDEAIVTHPAVIRAIVEKLESLAPAEIIVGDNPGFLGYGINEKTFHRTGLHKVQPLPLGHPFNDIHYHHVAEFLGCGPMRRGCTHKASAYYCDFLPSQSHW